MLRAIVPPIRVDKPTHAVRHRSEFGIFGESADWHVGLVHVAQRRGLNHLLVAEFSARHVQSHPLEHVFRARVDGACRSDE